MAEADNFRFATLGSEGRSLSLLSTLKRLCESLDRRPLYFSSLGGVGGGPPPQLGLPSRSSKPPSCLGGVGGGTSPTLSGRLLAVLMTEVFVARLRSCVLRRCSADLT
jgi:hypothetical protein